MREFLLSHTWIFGLFGLIVMYATIHFRDLWVGANSKMEDVLTYYAFVLLIVGSVHLWTEFLTWLLK